MKPLPDSMGFALSYTTQSFPVDMADNKDITDYSKYLDNAPGLTLSGGTVLRHVDFPPSNSPIMHRTVSLDYGVVLEGEVECILDSGEMRVLKRGDVCVQRGTVRKLAVQTLSDFKFFKLKHHSHDVLIGNLLKAFAGVCALIFFYPTFIFYPDSHVLRILLSLVTDFVPPILDACVEE